MLNIPLRKWSGILGESYNHPLIFIVGPTAVGKSRLAFDVAKSMGGQILNADSVQVYKKIQIGAAKPSSEELALVPHELFSFVSPPDKMTAGKFYKLAREKIFHCLKKGPVFLVGGSGFYIQAIEKGMFEAPASHPDLMQKYENQLKDFGGEALYKLLVERDPHYSRKVEPEDSYRVLRALVAMEESQKLMTEIHREFEAHPDRTAFSVPRLKLGLTMDRLELRKVVTQRVDSMLKNGLISEVEDLLAQNLEDWSPLSSVGYKETVEHLRGQLTAEEWRERMITSTMQLAKRQMTWFRRDKSLHWFSMPEGYENARQVMKSYIDEFNGENS